MAGDKLETVRQVYRAWDSPGGLASSIDLFAVDIEYVNPENAIEPGTRRGHAGMEQVIKALDSAFSRLTYVIHDLIEVDEERVLGLTTFKACGRDSGAWVEVAEQHVWTVRDGKIARFAWFHDERAARREAGVGPTGPRPRVD